MNPAIPQTLPVEFQDQIVSITSQLGVSGPIILVIRFSERLDAPRLARAARLLVDAEPILGCRFEMAGDEPAWRRWPDPDAVTWFEHMQAPEEEAALLDAMRQVEPLTGRNLIVRLLSCPGGDTLILTISHAVADGGAAYECAYGLATLYTALEADPDHRPTPNPASRDSFEWLAAFSFRHKARTLLRDLGALRHAGRSMLGVAAGRSLEAWQAHPRTTPCFVERRIGPDELEAIDRLAAAHGCGRMDVLVAGLARAFVDFVDGRPGQRFRVILPSNLRRFTQGGRRPSIRNMAGFATMTFDPARAAPFAQTLDAAAHEAVRVKRGLSGAMNPVAVALMRRMSYARKRRTLEGAIRRGMDKPAPPTFTNVGRLHEGRARFGGAAPDSALILTCAYPMPLVLLGGIEYRRTLSIAVAFQEADVPKARMQALVDGMVAQIPFER